MRKSLLENKKNWMKTIPDNISIAHLSIPGTHNSCARKGVLPGPEIGWTVCQNNVKTIPTQLNDGIRYLDMRCYAVNDFIEIVHDKYDFLITLNTVLTQCKEFLLKNNSEFIFMRIKQERSNWSDRDFIDLFNKVIAPYKDIVIQTSSLKTLGEVRGKIVIISNVSGLGGISWSSINHQDIQPCSIADKKSAVKSQINKCIQINNTEKKTQLFLNHASGYQAPFTFPETMAIHVNKELSSELLSGIGCDKVNNQKNESTVLGIIAMDYYREDVVSDIIKRNINGDIKQCRIVKIKNAHYEHYLYASVYVDSDGLRRNPYCWGKGEVVSNGYWVMVPDDTTTDVYWLMNTYHKEYLYPSTKLQDSSRRYVYTAITKLSPEAEGRFLIKTINGVTTIKSLYRGNYLYETKMSDAENRRIVRCWVPDVADYDAKWIIS